jgi:hypothetical protein
MIFRRNEGLSKKVEKEPQSISARVFPTMERTRG